MINMLNEDFVETKVISYVTPRGNINDETEIHPITVSMVPTSFLQNFTRTLSRSRRFKGVSTSFFIVPQYVSCLYFRSEENRKICC